MLFRSSVGTVTLGKSSARIMDGSPIGNSSTVHSTGPTLHRFKTTGHSTRSSSTAYEDQDQDHEYESDGVELSPLASQTTSFIVRVDHGDQQQAEHRQDSEGETNSSSEGEFSFVKPDPVEIRTTYKANHNFIRTCCTNEKKNMHLLIK